MNRTEELLQRQVISFLRLTSPDCVFYHCPNGGGRSPAEGGILKAMGVLPGVADICFILKGGQAAFIELKSDAGKLSPNQRYFQSECERYGALYAVCKSLAEVQGTLDAWGVVLRARIAA